MKYAYRGFGRSGTAESGEIDAPSAAEASELLRRRGLFVSEVLEARASGGGRGKAAAAPSVLSRLKRGRGGSRTKRLLGFSRQVHVVLRSGGTLVEALASAERQARDPRWAGVIADVRERVERGEALADALGRHPASFDRLVCSLVSAGESTGRLAEMLDRVAKLAHRQVQLSHTLSAAMTYPVVLVVISVSVLCLMLGFVVPRFSILFETLGGDVPPTTAAVMWMSGALRRWWWVLAGGLAALVVGLVTALRTERGRSAMDTAVLRAPLLGKVVGSLLAARVARLLGVLTESRVPLVEALGLTRASVRNRAFAALLAEAESTVREGEPLSSAFGGTPLAGGGLREALRSGEDSGDLATSLLTVADFMDEENDVLVKSVTSLLEPTILACMGLMVGGLAMSMFLPLFDMAGMV